MSSVIAVSRSLTSRGFNAAAEAWAEERGAEEWAEAEAEADSLTT
jgi:hypothetical protein